MKLDHLMRACSDLDKGIAEIAALTGVEAKCSGSYQGLGTRNASLSVGTVCTRCRRRAVLHRLA